MTPEEIAALQKRNEELEAAAKANASSSGSIQEKLAALEKENKERAERETALRLDLAKRDTLTKYGNLKGMEALVRGATPEEVEANAKALSEAVAAREAEFKKNIPPANPREQWDGVPRSVQNSLAISKDRQDEYAAVRADKAISKTAKLTKLMQMHIRDQSEKMVKGARLALGIE